MTQCYLAFYIYSLRVYYLFFSSCLGIPDLSYSKIIIDSERQKRHTLQCCLRYLILHSNRLSFADDINNLAEKNITWQTQEEGFFHHDSHARQSMTPSGQRTTTKRSEQYIKAVATVTHQIHTLTRMRTKQGFSEVTRSTYIGMPRLFGSGRRLLHCLG